MRLESPESRVGQVWEYKSRTGNVWLMLVVDHEPYSYERHHTIFNLETSELSNVSPFAFAWPYWKRIV